LTRIWAVLAGFLLLAEPARAAPLVADLSDHLVAITAGFAGADVLMFGAIEEPGDVVMIVKGPSERVAMHRKSWIGGIWINTATMTFDEVPSYYAIASSRPLEEIASETLLARNEMGVERLKLELPRAKASPNLAQEWRQALVRNKQRDGLYSSEVEKISFLGERLFRSRVQFPANVPTGNYRVDVFLLKDDRVISAQTTPLIVSKIGVEADIFDFAHQQSALYGIIAIFLALMAGWLAHVAFRKS
jgi:uncharacterized protein (TIGR02186 family)